MKLQSARRPVRFASLVVTLIAAPLLSTAVALQGGRSASFAFVHVSVVDGTGAPVKSDQTVVVSGDRITAVGRFGSLSIPQGGRTIDATGRFLIPGLWDAHVHTRFEGIDSFRLLVVNGITSARNMSAPWEYLPELVRAREGIGRDGRIGPRLLTAGPVLDGPGPGSGRATDVIVSTPDDARLAVRRVKREGADFAKVYNALSRESFFAIAAEAKAQGLPFAGHLPYAVTADEASDAGQFSIEHVDAIVRASSAGEEDIRQAQTSGRGDLARAIRFSVVDLTKLAPLAERLKKNGTVVVPTLSNYWKVLDRARGGRSVVASPERLRFVPGVYAEAWQTVRSPASVEDTQLLFDQCLIAVRELNRAGATLLAGTDASTAFQVPGFSLHDELSLLVKAGLSELQALQAATRNPALALHLRDQGTIEAGMRADLVLLDADPLQNIENTRRIRLVVADGRLFDRRDLDAMLEDVRRAASEWTGTPTR